MVDLLLLLLITIQAAVDITRERGWKHWAKQPGIHFIRINRIKASSLFFPIGAAALLLMGKFYFMVTGFPTVGLIALYLLMLFYFGHVYPYIILKDTEATICTHVFQPNIVISKAVITHASKMAHLLRIDYQPTDMPNEQRIILDTRSFPDIRHFEIWLGLHPVKTGSTPEASPTKKAA